MSDFSDDVNESGPDARGSRSFDIDDDETANEDATADLSRMSRRLGTRLRQTRGPPARYLKLMD